MRLCEKCLVVSLVWSMISLVYGKPQLIELNQRSVREVTNPFFRPQIPSITGNTICAGNSTFCENIDSYPYIHLKYILERNNSYYRYIFHKEEVKEELVNRQSPEGSFICRSISKTVFPKVGKNKSNKWKFIINQDGYLQGVRVETCYHSDRPCDIIGEVPSIYTTFCRQKYIYSKLLSLSDIGYPTPDVFKVPSACCCAYKRNISFLKQFGAPVSLVRFS